MTSEARAIILALTAGLWVSHTAYMPRSWRIVYRYRRLLAHHAQR